MQIPLGLRSASPPQVRCPPSHLIKPTARNNNTRDGIHKPNDQVQETRALLADEQHDRLNVILEEDTWDEVGGFREGVRCRGRRILVCEDEVLVVLSAVLVEGGGESVQPDFLVA